MRKVSHRNLQKHDTISDNDMRIIYNCFVNVSNCCGALVVILKLHRYNSHKLDCTCMHMHVLFVYFHGILLYICVCYLVADPKNRDLPVAFDGSTFLQYPNEITVQ